MSPKKPKLTVINGNATPATIPTQAQIMQHLTPETVAAWLAIQTVNNYQGRLLFLVQQMPEEFFVFALFYAQIFATETQRKSLEKKGVLTEDKSPQEVALAYWNSFPLIKQLKFLEGLVQLNPNIIECHEAEDVRILQESIYKTYQMFCEGKVEKLNSHRYLNAVYKAALKAV